MPASLDIYDWTGRLWLRGRLRRQMEWYIGGTFASRLLVFAIALFMIASPARADCPVIPVATAHLLSNGRPLVEASIDGHSVEMLVDTGAQYTAVTPKIAARLGLPRDPGQRMMVHTIGGNGVSANVIVRRLKVSTLSFPDLSATVVGIPPMANGFRPDGVIGADALSQYDLGLDIPHRTLTFYQTAGCTPISPPWQGQYQTVSARVEGRRFIIPATLNGHPMRAQFDTGSRGETILLVAAHHIGITGSELDDDPSDTFLSAGMHQYRVYRHLFQTFGVGQETFRNLRLDVADFRQPGIDMLVGADYMHARRFFISYASSTLFIQREGMTAQPAAPPLQGMRHVYQCRPTLEIRRMLAPGHPILVKHPPISLPASVRADHVTGCVAAMFHIGADGMPVHIKVVKVHPASYGLRSWIVQTLSQARFEPSTVGSAWYYEAIRFHAQ